MCARANVSGMARSRGAEKGTLDLGKNKIVGMQDWAAAAHAPVVSGAGGIRADSIVSVIVHVAAASAKT